VSVSFAQLIVELRTFDQRREIVKALNKGLRAAALPVRKEIRQVAVDTLPSGGGLNLWVAKIRINLRSRTSGRRAGIKLVGSRKSTNDRSDVAAIDRGRVRHPSWGRRGNGQWHTTLVEPGFFTQTAADSRQWQDEAETAIDRALDQLRRG
jgi:hypothetical protein